MPRLDSADLNGPYYEALLEISPLATVTLDREAKVTAWNPAAQDLFGYSSSEAVTRPLEELVGHPAEVRSDRHSLTELAAEAGRTSAITRRRCRDGSLVDVEVVAAPVRRDGRCVGYVATYEDVGERRRAEQERRRAENRYLDLIERLPLAVYIDRLDDVSSNIYTSPQLESMLGYSVEEWTTDEELFLKVVHDDDRERVLAAHARSRETGEPFRMEYRMVTRDGTVRWFLDQASAVVDEQTGLPAYHHGFLLDITERKELEEALREAERRYRDLVEELPLAVYIDEATPAAASKYVSPQIEEMFGYPASEWLTDRELFPRLLHPDDRARVLAEHEQVFATGQSRWEFEYRLIARDGRTVWVRDEAVIVTDEEGKPLHVQGFLIDITQRRMAEQARQASEEELRRQKQYFESLVHISPAAVVTLDLDERVTSWNPAAERLFGWTGAEAIGREIDDLVLGTAGLRDEGMVVTKIARERGSAHLISRRSRKDGSLVDVEILLVPLEVGGEPIGFYVIYHDVSELQRARQEAEAATQAKSVFLATMSHEIRTPMNAVIGMTELLLGTELDAEQRSFAEVIRTSGDTLLKVIDDILDFSKIESGKLELESRPFELRECVEAALDLVATRAADKGLELGCLIDPDVPPEIMGDPTRLRQVLINLVSNGVKFTEEGEVVVSVARDGSEAGRHRLHVTVRDTGIGIPEERMGDLFQSFSQVDASTSRRFGGTGLGLAISKRLTELMGGDMSVESVVGQGSTFHFAFLAEEAKVPAPPHAGGDQPQLHDKRLLVVDDSATNREIVVRQARSWGMLPRATGRPTEALSWVERGDPFDAAVLDMQMPEMDGVDLAGRIRKHPAGETLPLVLLTSLGRRERGRGARQFAATLAKPVRASQLYEALLEILASWDGRAAQPEAPQDEGAIRASAHPLRILVAEDNGVNQKLALKLLAKLGYQADVAENGVEAVEAVKSDGYDVVLMDVQMPELDGLAATRRIRARHPHGPPRIIAMTANALQEDREACLAAGMDDYLVKPIHLAQLGEALGSVAPSRHESPALDGGALDSLREQFDDAGFVEELVDTFLREAPRLLRDLRSPEPEEARRAAHTLKTNARTLGAAELGRLCEELENLARREGLTDGGAAAARAEVEYDRVESALRAMR